MDNDSIYITTEELDKEHLKRKTKTNVVLTSAEMHSKVKLYAAKYDVSILAVMNCLIAKLRD